MCETDKKTAIKVFPTPLIKENKVKSKTSKNPTAYYNCMLNASMNGFNGQKITDICRSCKLNGHNLALTRQQQLHELRTNYQRIGEIINFLTSPLAHD